MGRRVIANCTLRAGPTKRGDAPYRTRDNRAKNSRTTQPSRPRLKPAPFSYFRVTTLGEAFERLEEFGPDGRILAARQSLMPTLNMRLSAPEALIDINPIDELRGISVTDSHVRVGALTRHSDMERSPEVARHLPLISEAIRHVAHPAIRNRGTVGGSIALADPAAELPA